MRAGLLSTVSLMYEGSGPPWVHLPNADPISNAENIPVPEATRGDDERMFHVDAPSSTIAFGSTDGDADVTMAPPSPSTEDTGVDTAQRSLRIGVDAWVGASTPVKSLAPTQQDTPSTHTSTRASSHNLPAAAPPALPPAPPTTDAPG